MSFYDYEAGDFSDNWAIYCVAARLMRAGHYAAARRLLTLLEEHIGQTREITSVLRLLPEIKGRLRSLAGAASEAARVREEPLWWRLVRVANAAHAARRAAIACFYALTFCVCVLIEGGPSSPPTACEWRPPADPSGGITSVANLTSE